MKEGLYKMRWWVTVYIGYTADTSRYVCYPIEAASSARARTLALMRASHDYGHGCSCINIHSIIKEALI